MPQKKASFWRRLFGRVGGDEERALPDFDRFVRSASPPPSSRGNPEFRRSTGVFIREAIEQRRFETAAFVLVSKGKASEAVEVGDRAMAEGKYEQALKIFSKTGDSRKMALAAEAAARDCLRRGGSRKRAIDRLYLAIQAYARQPIQQEEERVATLRHVAGLADELAKVLREDGNHVAAGDTFLYAARVYRLLLPFAWNPKWMASDPAFFDGLQERIRERAVSAREEYRVHVEARSLSPEGPEGQKIVKKLKEIGALLGGDLSRHG